MAASIPITEILSAILSPDASIRGPAESHLSSLRSSNLPSLVQSLLSVVSSPDAPQPHKELSLVLLRQILRSRELEKHPQPLEAVRNAATRLLASPVNSLRHSAALLLAFSADPAADPDAARSRYRFLPPGRD